jgi:hypothetical protein
LTSCAKYARNNHISTITLLHVMDLIQFIFFFLKEQINQFFFAKAEHESKRVYALISNN